MRVEIIKDFKKHSDTELLKITAESSSDSNLSFKEIYNRYSKQVFGYCIHNHYDRDFAQNVFQDAWVSLFDYIISGRKINSIIALLITICRRRIIDDLRKDKAKPEFVKFDKVADYIEDNNNIDIDYSQIINEAINQLDEKVKDIFIMNKISGLTINEIAEITGEKFETVKKRIYRAQLKVKEYTLNLLNEEKK